MDAISTAIVAAITSGAVAGTSKIGEQGIVDGYAKLKDLLKDKFGKRSEVVKAVQALEAKPDSGPRKEVVAEEVTAANCVEDPELLQAAQTLLVIMKARGGVQLTQTAIGDRNIQVAGDRNAITVQEPVVPDGGMNRRKSK